MLNQGFTTSQPSNMNSKRIQTCRTLFSIHIITTPTPQQHRHHLPQLLGLNHARATARPLQTSIDTSRAPFPALLTSEMEGRANEDPKGTSRNTSTTTSTSPSRHRRNRTVDLGNQVIPASASLQTITPVVARLRSRTGAAETARSHPLYSAYGNDDPSPTFSRASIGEQRLNPSYHEPGLNISRSGTPAPFANRGVDLNRPSDRDFLSQRNLSLPARNENLEAFPSYSENAPTTATNLASIRPPSVTPGRAQLPAFNLQANQAAYLEVTANSPSRIQGSQSRDQSNPRALQRRDSNQLVGRLRLPGTTPASLRNQFQRLARDNAPTTPITNAQAPRQASGTQPPALRRQRNRTGTLSGGAIGTNPLVTPSRVSSAPEISFQTTTALPQDPAAAPTATALPSNNAPITPRGRAATRNRAETFLNAERPNIEALLARTAPGTTPLPTGTAPAPALPGTDSAPAPGPGPTRPRARRELERQ